VCACDKSRSHLNASRQNWQNEHRSLELMLLALTVSVVVVAGVLVTSVIGYLINRVNHR
jgi:F0F1-type ATP synthase assembly protein I